MKILYINHARELSGWGQASKDYAEAMNSVGLDVASRSIKFDNSKLDPNSKIHELEKKSTKNCDIVIQHVLPHLMEYSGNFKKNIGMFASESHSIRPTSWVSHLNLLDTIIVFNNMQAEATRNSGVIKPIKIIPHACNLKRYDIIYPTLNLNLLKNTFKFYFIGEANQRKNLHTLIKAFHIEFNKQENTELIIKTNDRQYVNNIIEQVKSGLRLYPEIKNYKQEVIIDKFLSESRLSSLHQVCDCFVMPSFGEAWSIPCFDSLGFGNPVIASNTGGMADYIEDKINGWLIPCRKEPVFGCDHIPFTDLNTSRETWDSIDLLELIKKMRLSYNMWQDDKNSWKQMQENAKESVKKYSYEKVGNLIKELIEE